MEDFVTYELAVKLKEKGFNWCLITTYNKKTRVSNHHSEPTISQVLKWFRKEKEIYISIFIDDDSDNPVTYEIWKGTECVCSHQGEYFTLKEWSKCELRAIEYVLDNLI